MGYLRAPEPYIAYGSNLLDSTSEKFVFNYLDNTYNLFEGDYMLQHDGTKPVSLYRFRSDVLLKKNVLSQFPEVVTSMEQKIKAIIQQYNNRMVDDKLTP